MTDLTQLLEQYESLSPMKKAEIDKLVREDILDKPWRPLINIDTPEIITPQQQAFDSKADILLFGGAAGGGKSSLLIGLALTSH